MFRSNPITIFLFYHWYTIFISEPEITTSDGNCNIDFWWYSFVLYFWSSCYFNLTLRVLSFLAPEITVTEGKPDKLATEKYTNPKTISLYALLHFSPLACKRTISRSPKNKHNSKSIFLVVDKFISLTYPQQYVQANSLTIRPCKNRICQAACAHTTPEFTRTRMCYEAIYTLLVKEKWKSRCLFCFKLKLSSWSFIFSTRDIYHRW